jgi:cell division protein FtsL
MIGELWNALRHALARLRLALAETRPGGLMLPLVMAMLVIGSALYAIRVKHDNRSFTTELERARVERERMQMEWSQLQLEEAALSHHARVENAARELGMAEPRDYVILQQQAAERTP